MSKDKKKNKEVSKSYGNPIKSVWGKIIIIIISVAMVAGILASLIYLLIKNFAAV